MAFYNSNSYSYYDYDYKDYKDDYNTHQDSYSYSDYEFQPQNFINSTSYYNNQFQYNPTNISYSTTFFYDPKHDFYDPKTYNHVLAQTEYMVSYSVSQSGKMNDEYDDEYDEYDPTPYGGGYDLVLTYGKPLPPSDEICYPRSSHHNHQEQDRVDDPSMGVSGFNGVLALDDIPYVDEEFDKPQVEDVNMEKVHEKVVEQEEQKQKNLIEYAPNWSDVDSGNVNKRNGNDYNGENENLVAELETQSGYDDSKAMDLCESLFGYWNGLSLQKGEEDKNYGGQGGHVDNVDTNPMSQWDEGPADYLFGCSDSHGELRIETGMYDSPIFGYEKHYQEPLQYGQVEYDPYYYHNCRVSEHEF